MYRYSGLHPEILLLTEGFSNSTDLAGVINNSIA